MRIKYKNYEALFIHEKGNRTSMGADFATEITDRFKSSKTAVKLVIWKATHNNTRIKKYAEYDLSDKSVL